MDYAGLALVIVACGSFVTAAGTVYVAIRQQAMAARLKETHDLVNGMSAELQKADKKIAFNEGKEAERETPMVPAKDVHP